MNAKIVHVFFFNNGKFVNKSKMVSICFHVFGFICMYGTTRFSCPPNLSSWKEFQSMQSLGPKYTFDTQTLSWEQNYLPQEWHHSYHHKNLAVLDHGFSKIAQCGLTKLNLKKKWVSWISIMKREAQWDINLHSEPRDQYPPIKHDLKHVFSVTQKMWIRCGYLPLAREDGTTASRSENRVYLLSHNFPPFQFRMVSFLIDVTWSLAIVTSW